MTRDPKDVAEYLKEIELAAGVKITALVNNSNLGRETTAKTVLDSADYASECEKSTNLKVAWTAVRKDLIKDLEKKIPNLFPIEMIKYGEWE